MKMEHKVFPEGMAPLGDSSFHFRCHSGVPCFTRCCGNVDLFLYPYDIIRLKKNLALSSEEFLRRFVTVVQGGNPFFPSLMLTMTENDKRSCPFLDAEGCKVYSDRPSACRMYPLERAVDRTPQRGLPREYFFLTHHDYCLGHGEMREWTVREWVRDQQLHYYNVMDDLWAGMDTLFRENPWQGEGAGGPRQQVAFMVCYNIDGFRHYAREHRLLEPFKLSGARRRDIQDNDEELLKFGFDWLRFLFKAVPVPKGK